MVFAFVVVVQLFDRRDADGLDRLESDQHLQHVSALPILLPSTAATSYGIAVEIQL